MDDPKPLDELQHPDWNPRRISAFDFNNLVKSMQEFGDLSGVVKNIETGHLVGGNQRVEAFKQLSATDIHITWHATETPRRNGPGTVAYGYVLLPNGERFGYREVTWDEGREKLANVAANRITGEWDKDLLAQVNYELANWDPEAMALTGQSDQEINDSLDMAARTTIGEDAGGDEAPVVDDNQPAASQPGEVYQLGSHRLLCGDATDSAQIQKFMAGKAADMIFSDPPYNVDYVGKTASALKIENDHMDVDKFYDFLLAAFGSIYLATKPGGAVYVCHSDAEGLTFRLAMRDAGFQQKSCLIWVKQSLVLGRSDYHSQHEQIAYALKPGAPHYFTQDRTQTTLWEDLRQVSTSFDGEYTIIKAGPYEVRVLGQAEGEVHRKNSQTDVWRFDRPSRSIDHPTMKPLALCEQAIINSSQRGQIVLDVFGGSGSTLIAAERIGRICYMAEISPKYCDVIRRRYHQHVTGSEAGWQEATLAIDTPGVPRPAGEPAA